ncbi:MAG: DNA gyrase subunit B [Planctomycetes bacterium]|nr:DNA gyrase subunit B [Planctomycetota bacterium]
MTERKATGINVSTTPVYDESKVRVLEGTEHVRKRPAMYIGDTGLRGLHHLVYEVVDNSIDEAMAGACSNISVEIKADGSASISDDGRGFPVGIKEEYGLSALELCLTRLGAGAKFDRDSYKVSGGLHGVGVSVVNALSEWLKVETARDGQVWVMAFERGRTVAPLTATGETTRTGTRVDFKPDAEVFREIDFHCDILAKRLRELAYLNLGLTISLIDERDDKVQTFCFERGIREFVEHLNEGKQPLHPAVYFKREDPDQRLITELAFQYTDGYSETTLSFANNINTVEGGTHLSGFRSALTRAVNNYARKSNLFKSNAPIPQGEDVREGLTAVISVKVPEPQFEGQTKTKLGNSEVGTFVETTVNEMISLYLEEHPAEAKRVIAKATQAAFGREAARRARETARKSALSGGGLSRKLVDCSSRDVDSTELFIVEGDSAAGSAKGYRDASTQAILPIRGKILNVEKARLHKVLGHEEIVEIIKALGTGIGAEDFDLSKLRYGRIILMTDADVDGSHIRTLLLTFFFRHLRPLIDEGRVYIAQPPLFQLAKGKKSEYLLGDAELNMRLTELGLEQTRLEIRRPESEIKISDGTRLAGLLRLVDEIDHQARILRRRGIILREFISAQYRDGTLPTWRALSGDEERYFYSENELVAYQQARAAAGADTVRSELNEVRALQEHLGQLGDFGCEVGDLFLRREELVTGEISPAVFVLEHPQAGLVELDNLSGLPSGVRTIGARGWELKRFKGLGEMNKEELWETTMDPANRVLRKVIVGETDADPEQADLDAVETDRIFSILMGENVESRRQFIEDNAIHVKNLDI